MATSRENEIRHAPKFYKGAVFERVSDSSLWIEGRPVCIVDDGPTKLAKLATGETFTADSLDRLATVIIDGAEEFKERRRLASEHRHILDQCAKARDPRRSWAEWRQSHPEVHPMLADQELSGQDFSGFDFSYANLCMANLQRTELKGTSFHQAILAKADCHRANFSDANFCRTDLFETDLREAKLIGTNLQGVQLAGTNCKGALFEDCTVYGVSAWDLKRDESTKQKGFRIRTSRNEPEITADNIELAQFIYLLLHNENIRNVIDTITSKIVLILGRFSENRKVILDAIRDQLRAREDLLPVIFDFSIPASRDVSETVTVLAGLARFVIADITDATEIRAELHDIVQNFTSLPIQAILLRGEPGFVSYSHVERFPGVLPLFEYDNQEHLLANLDQHVVRPAEAKVLELRRPQPE
jgi:hypothetical protein